MHTEKGLPFCHIWYNDSVVPIVSPATKYQMVGGAKHGGHYLFPHILGCHPPDSGMTQHYLTFYPTFYLTLLNITQHYSTLLNIKEYWSKLLNFT